MFGDPFQRSEASARRLPARTAEPMVLPREWAPAGVPRSQPADIYGQGIWFFHTRILFSGVRPTIDHRAFARGLEAQVRRFTGADLVEPDWMLGEPRSLGQYLPGWARRFASLTYRGVPLDMHGELVAPRPFRLVDLNGALSNAIAATFVLTPIEPRTMLMGAGQLGGRSLLARFRAAGCAGEIDLRQIVASACTRLSAHESL